MVLVAGSNSRPVFPWKASENDKHDCPHFCPPSFSFAAGGTLSAPSSPWPPRCRPTPWRAVSYSVAGGGRVDIRLELAEPTIDASDFSTESPPRIAIDLNDTSNRWHERRGCRQRRGQRGFGSGSRWPHPSGDRPCRAGQLQPAPGRRQPGRRRRRWGRHRRVAGAFSRDRSTKRAAISTSNELDRIDFRRGGNGEAVSSWSFPVRAWVPTCAISATASNLNWPTCACPSATSGVWTWVISPRRCNPSMSVPWVTVARA